MNKSPKQEKEKKLRKIFNNMKKVLVIIFLLMFCSMVYAYEEVYLDLNSQAPKQYDFGQFQYQNTPHRIDEDDIKPSFSNMLRMFKEDFIQDNQRELSQEKNAE